MASHHVSAFRRSARAARRATLVAMTAALLPTALQAQAQDYEGKNITAVEVRYRGSRTVDEGRLRNYMTSKAGETYRTEKIDKDIKSLYESGLVDDVRFLAEPAGDGVRLIAEVSTRSSLDAVGFTGNTKFSDEKLARESKLKSGGVLSDSAILEARRNIEKYYQGYGYPDVTVSHRLQANASGGSDLVFVVDEGSRNEVRDIRFEGNHNISSPDLKKVMKTKEKGIFSFLTKSGRIQGNQLDEDQEAILDEYRSKGYLRASCPGIRREPVRDGRVDLVIPINEGDKYTVAGVGFGKMTVFKPEELHPALTLTTGKAYSSKKMRDDITMIRNYYGSRGYADAHVSPDISDAGPNKVNIVYRITEGPRVRVGRVNIEGNTKTKDKVIRREIPLKPGDWFNSVELETTQKRLQNLQYFSEVQATGVPTGGGYRDVNVLVEERKTGSVGVGVGFSSIDNIVGFLTLEQTNFDLFNPWGFTGGGQRFSMNLRLGSQRSEFSVSLVEPWFLDRQLSLGGELYYRNARFFSDVYDQSTAGATTFLRWPFGPKGSVKLDYRLEQIGIDVDNNLPLNSAFRQEDGDYLRSALGLTYIYDSRDSNIIPRTGEKLEASTMFSGLGGDVKDYSISLQGQKYWNLWFDSILSLTGELATVDSYGDETVPVFDRVFLGGGRTLRGFEFRDIGGARDSSGEVLGGQSLAYLTTEVTVPVIDAVRAAVFFDVGFVNTGSWDFAPNDVYSDVGVGVRLKLPISPLPLALDYAVPVSSPDPQADEGGQFNFYLNYTY